jgi:prophage antirepressor-like protein
MTNLTTFQFNTQEVRVITIDGEPWFLGADVCRVLEIKNYSDAYSRLKDYEKTIGNTEGVDNPDTVYISESGLYRLVLTSRKPQAGPFQDWVVQEVLPSIRKTGSYQIQPLSTAEVVLQSAQVLVDHEKRLTEHSMKLAIIEQRFAKVDEELKQLPPATEEVPEKSIRSCLNEVIRGYAYRTGESYQNLWRNLYKEYRYRHHVDLVARAKNQGKTVCEYAEEVGVIDKLYAIALIIYSDASIVEM